MGRLDGEEWEVGPGEAVLPDALERIGNWVFNEYPEIKAIWFGNNSVADSLRYGYGSTVVFSNKLMMVGNKFLRDLRG